MPNVIPANPFLTKGYINEAYFCDREEETKQILAAIINQRDLVIYGKRKMGKSALIKHVFHQLPKNTLKVWIDLLPSQTFDDMLTLTAQAIIDAYEKDDHLGKKVWSGLTKLRPTLSYDEYSGTPNISFDISSPKAQVETFSELIKLLSRTSKKVVLAFDEFQQIQNYPEKNTEEYLRTLLQSLPNISVLFSGSDQHMLLQMFENMDRPFYAFGQYLKIGPIDMDKYVAFIQGHFKKKKRKIEASMIYDIIEWCSGKTHNIQIIANRLYGTGIKSIKEEDLMNVKKQVLQDKEDIYYTLKKLISKGQWKVIEAIADSGKVYEPYGKAFMKRYKFTNSSTIRRVIQFCLDKSLIYQGQDETADYFELEDVFLKRWIQMTKVP